MNDDHVGECLAWVDPGASLVCVELGGSMDEVEEAIRHQVNQPAVPPAPTPYLDRAVAVLRGIRRRLLSWSPWWLK